LKKKILLLFGLVVLVVFQAAIAWNAFLYWKAKAPAASPAARIRLLRRAAAAYPWNDLVSFELGRACFERGAEALGNPAERDALFSQAVGSFLRSLRLNPGSPEVHFHFAQTLLYMNFLSLPAPVSYFEEYKKAAELTGHNSQIYFEVGRVLLARWETLSAAEKDFTLDILRKTLAGKDEGRLLDLLETWSLEVRDTSLVDKILPDDAVLLRAYARFLGEKSFALEARLTALARAEQLDLLRAKNELDLGRRDAEAFRNTEASGHYARAIEALGAIKFYQVLAGRELFNPREYAEVRKSARRLLAMSRVEATRSLADADGAIAAYLDIEDQVTDLGQFETFLKERGLLGERPTAASPAKDLPTLAFRMALDFQQNRYRDIVRVGDLLASSSLVISPSGRASYVRVLRLIGESCLKLDYVYEAEKYFRMALEIEPENLDVLLGIERCYDRLNDEIKAVETRRTIDRLVTPGTIDLGGRLLQKGETFEQVLVTDGLPRRISLGFSAATAGSRPLVSVFFNGRVVWEGMADAGPASFPVLPRPGGNSLEITAVSDSVALTGISQDLSPISPIPVR
jgi:tetratricopeptide (TPR) repeat protein